MPGAQPLPCQCPPAPQLSLQLWGCSSSASLLSFLQARSRDQPGLQAALLPPETSGQLSGSEDARCWSLRMLLPHGVDPSWCWLHSSATPGVQGHLSSPQPQNCAWSLSPQQCHPRRQVRGVPPAGSQGGDHPWAFIYRQMLSLGDKLWSKRV